MLHLLSLSVLLKFQINYQLFLLSGKLSGILSGFVTFPLIFRFCMYLISNWFGLLFAEPENGLGFRV